jgi:hypothetical protein
MSPAQAVAERKPPLATPMPFAHSKYNFRHSRNGKKIKKYYFNKIPEYPTIENMGVSC